MKKTLFVLLLGAMLCFTACKSEEDKTDEVDKFAENMQQEGATWVVEPSEAVVNAMCGTWNVVDSDDVYEFKSNGVGRKNDALFTFECGFDSDNKITLHITMDDDQSEEAYRIATDLTGHGVTLTALNGGEDKCFLPDYLEFLALDDVRAEGINGEWSDVSDNKYILDENMGLLIKGKNGDSEGTYSVVEDEDGVLILTLVVNGSALSFEYELNDAKNEMTLKNYPSEEGQTEHVWTK